jgi:CDP-diacylglycerol---glycerol-3-phosphate 3-phosphatidyltransferase
MTLPNKLTVTRLFCTPFVFLTWFLAFHLGWSPKIGTFLIWILFIISEITDILDGHIARTRGQVSDIGKLMDPFSDVFLRVTYFICFVGAGLMPIWTLIIILWRELGIMFIRMLLAREGVALAANKGGKLKSALYFVGGTAGLGALTVRAWKPEVEWLDKAETVVSGLFIVAALASLISFVDYFRGYLKTDSFRKFLSE